MSAKNDSRLRRARRSRARMRRLGDIRLSVHRTPRHIYAQVIAAEGDKVLASASMVARQYQHAKILFFAFHVSFVSYHPCLMIL